MSNLDELIKQYCPHGVEFQRLGNVATITRGGNFQKKDYVEEGVPCIHYGQIYTTYGLFVYEPISFISTETSKKQKYAQPNDVVMAVTSENIEDVCKCVAWLGNEPIAVSGHAAIIHHSMNAKYLVYYLRSQEFFDQKVKLAHGTKVIEVTPDKLNDIIIPVPPLPIQQEIVRILDEYTAVTDELKSELNAELTARKLQCSYYRDQLLTFDDDIKIVRVGDIATFNYGYTDKAKEKGNTRFVRITDITDNGTLNPEDAKYVDLSNDNKQYLLKEGDILMARTGATYGKTVYIPRVEQAVYASFLIKLNLDCSVIMPRYYWHFAQSDRYWQQADLYASHGGQQQFNTKAVARVQLPLPSLEKQKEIVEKLDVFSEITSDLEKGLPKEIELRTKQYEYYRDKLLNFKRKDEA